VTQKRTGLDATMFPARTAASSNSLISGRSPSETSSGCTALWVGPPEVYGWCDQTSKWTAVLQIACGFGPFDMQSIRLMKSSGATDRKNLFETVNGESPPATTRLSA